jgi:hypothetical protein
MKLGKLHCPSGLGLWGNDTLPEFRKVVHLRVEDEQIVEMSTQSPLSKGRNGQKRVIRIF